MASLLMGSSNSTFSFGLEQDSLALAEQAEALDKTCLLEKRGTIEDEMIMAKVTRALQIQIGAVDKYN